MLSQIFWILFGLEALVAVGLGVAAFSGKGWGPEGPVGAWILFIPIVFLVVLGVAVLITRSPAIMLVGMSIMVVPLIASVAGPVLDLVDKRKTQRSIAGDDNFTEPAQRALAHAIRANDLASAKNLIAGAGDLNRIHNGQTFLAFAAFNTTDAAIVQALIDAGANPLIGDEGGSYALTGAMYRGPEMTEALLKAGADPNHTDSAGRPVWWSVLSDDSDKGLATLLVLLDHGADIRKRDTRGGPVGWAAYHASQSFTANWRLVWMLIERGAEWKEESQFDRTVTEMFQASLSRKVDKTPSEAMRKIAALLDVELPAQ